MLPLTERFSAFLVQGRSVTVQVADRCASCAEFDLELSVPAFADIAGDSPGPVRISWSFD